jgi:hypothetical protein
MDLMPTGDWIEPADEVAIDAARRLTDRIKLAVEATWHLLQEAYTSRAWFLLGYDSWDAYCAAEFPKLRLPREEQDDVVLSLRDSGLSVRAISSATGVGYGTVQRTIAEAGDPPGSPVQGIDGKTYTPRPPEQTTVADHAPMETVTPTVTTAPKRRPLPAAFDDATADLGKAAEKLQRLTADDRFGRNRDQTHHRMPELIAALRTTTDALAAMNLGTAQASEEARRWWATSLHTISGTLTGLADALINQNEEAI